MHSSRIIPESYFTDIAYFFNQLPEKHAEKQVEKSQHELSLRLMADTPYLPFYEVFMKLNKTYGPQGDYASLYLHDPNFIRCRYPTIFTRRQKEFSNHWPLDNIYNLTTEHQPGNIPPGIYPAAKIHFSKDKNDRFSVLGEGPFQHTFQTLLTHLEKLKINVIIAVGPPAENGKEKYYNYLEKAEEINAENYLYSTANIKNISEAFKDFNNFTIKFYRYQNPANNNVFFVMHIPNWKDLGLPSFTDLDKQLLAYDAQFGGNRFYHCSAGVGRSVTILVMHAAYELIYKKNLNFNQAVDVFENILKNIKEVKPRAGEWWQLLLAVGLAEDIYRYITLKLSVSAKHTTSSGFTSLFPKLILTLPLRKSDRSDVYCTQLGLGCAPIGNYPTPLSDETAYQTIKKAYECGIRVFDTAPLYGYGLSEIRLGTALFELLNIPRDKVFISSKVGRILVPDSQSKKQSLFPHSLPFRDVFDYSGGGIINAIEGSLVRLKTTYLDAALVHDLGLFTHTEKDVAMLNLNLFVNSGYKALLELKQQGVIKAIGIGVNEYEIILQLLQDYQLDFDFILLAQRYTLLEQGEKTEEFFKECEARKINVLIGAPLSSGILSDDPNNATFRYEKAHQEILDKKDNIKKICNLQGVHLQQAALHFPLLQPSVKTVIMGARSPKEIEQAVSHINRKIPSELWNDLEKQGILPKQKASMLLTTLK